MATYLQMGHNSSNLLTDPACGPLAGAVLSPIDLSEADTATLVAEHAESDLQFVFDPQLYFPRTARRNLEDWNHFPDDVETADLSSHDWWSRVCAAIAQTASNIGVDVIASPAQIPRVFSDEYYEATLNVAQELATHVGSIEAVMPTLVLQMADLSEADRVMQLASLATSYDFPHAYLIFRNTTEARREVRDADDLIGCCNLITRLQEAGVDCTIGFSSSEAVLWKRAGACHCATGKFFNTRRFTDSRFQGPTSGGGQLPYFFEEALLAFLRGPDVERARRLEIRSQSTDDNPNTTAAEEQIALGSNRWVGTGWRQFIWWFGCVCERIEADRDESVRVVNAAALAWELVRSRRTALEEAPNDGGWVDAWQAVVGTI